VKIKANLLMPFRIDYAKNPLRKKIWLIWILIFL